MGIESFAAKALEEAKKISAERMAMRRAELEGAAAAANQTREDDMRKAWLQNGPKWAETTTENADGTRSTSVDPAKLNALRDAGYLPADMFGQQKSAGGAQQAAGARTATAPSDSALPEGYAWGDRGVWRPTPGSVRPGEGGTLIAGDRQFLIQGDGYAELVPRAEMPQAPAPTPSEPSAQAQPTRLEGILSAVPQSAKQNLPNIMTAVQNVKTTEDAEKLIRGAQPEEKAVILDLLKLQTEDPSAFSPKSVDVGGGALKPELWNRTPMQMPAASTPTPARTTAPVVQPVAPVSAREQARNAVMQNLHAGTPPLSVNTDSFSRMGNMLATPFVAAGEAVGNAAGRVRDHIMRPGGTIPNIIERRIAPKPKPKQISERTPNPDDLLSALGIRG